MRGALIAAMLAAAALTASCETTLSAAQDAATLLTVEEVVRNADRYHGRTISVVGLVFLREDSKNLVGPGQKDTRSCIALLPDTYAYPNPYDAKTLVVTGYFEKDGCGPEYVCHDSCGPYSLSEIRFQDAPLERAQRAGHR